jgi:hypothetical protein
MAGCVPDVAVEAKRKPPKELLLVTSENIIFYAKEFPAYNRLPNMEGQGFFFRYCGSIKRALVGKCQKQTTTKFRTLTAIRVLLYDLNVGC